ncbi:Protein of unknown function [Pyronema omphalodes CBS 100304]|uniref:Uncharacterized protein n=1 Tax=Pyronema omphalodes (strain CBS 100304) TaxID=1076935 RepID=U4LIZ9_PYROM|nr:Protein of unknown function [Pyronema omphalodes CBS 100304]
MFLVGLGGGGGGFARGEERLWTKRARCLTESAQSQAKSDKVGQQTCPSLSKFKPLRNYQNFQCRGSQLYGNFTDIYIAPPNEIIAAAHRTRDILSLRCCCSPHRKVEPFTYRSYLP